MSYNGPVRLWNFKQMKHFNNLRDHKFIQRLNLVFNNPLLWLHVVDLTLTHDSRYERSRGDAARRPGLQDKVHTDKAGRERRMHTWLSLAGNFKVQDLNGWKKTSAVRQWMAKENREAKHMLGHNDPKNNTKKKRRCKWKEHMYTKDNDKSISQQAAQAMLSSSAPFTHPLVKSIAFVCWLCLQRMLLERGEKT